MRFNLLPLALFASTVLANGASILASINQISNATIALKTAVTSWKGDLFGVLSVVGASITLLGDINAGTKTAQNSTELTLGEVISIVGPTQTLVADVDSALSAVTAAKEKFAKLYLAPIIKFDLELEKNSSDQFSAAVVSKVPAAFQGVAKSLTAPIDVAFGYALGNFTGLA